MSELTTTNLAGSNLLSIYEMLPFYIQLYKSLTLYFSPPQSLYWGEAPPWERSLPHIMASRRLCGDPGSWATWTNNGQAKLKRAWRLARSGSMVSGYPHTIELPPATACLLSRPGVSQYRGQDGRRVEGRMNKLIFTICIVGLWCFLYLYGPLLFLLTWFLATK